jgi:hypothetical protein
MMFVQPQETPQGCAYGVLFALAPIPALDGAVVCSPPELAGVVGHAYGLRDAARAGDLSPSIALGRAVYFVLPIHQFG